MIIKTSSVEEILPLLFQVDVDFMSKYLFGMPYNRLKSLIYPQPRYRSFSISKRNGKQRFIDAPSLKVKQLQEKILQFLYVRTGQPKPCVHGFTPKRSVVTNAKMHWSPKTQHLLNIDIQDFFPSISFYRVRGLFQKQPFNCSYEVATVLAHICTFKGSLPQGAPTSPLIANLICRSLDGDLMKLARRHRSIYSRYADDITFSFSVRRSDRLPSNICTFDSGIVSLGEELKTIFSSHNFRINPDKSRISSRLHRLEVTGITINDFPNVKRDFIDGIRGALHAWEKYGYKNASSEWEKRVHESRNNIPQNRAWKRQTRTESPPSLERYLWGKLLYLRMVRGKDDLVYGRLAKRFNSLCEEGGLGIKLPIDPIVRTREDAEDAVFVIEWSGNYKFPVGTPNAGLKDMVGGQGTAFAYRNADLITCSHVFDYAGDVKVGGKNIPINTSLDSGDVFDAEIIIRNASTNKEWRGSLVRRENHYDLALITFLDPKPAFHHHFIGRESTVHSDEEGILIGFPNYSPGKQADFLDRKVLNPYPRSGLSRFDISGTIRQGNSGGPFVDKTYKVCGVAQQGATQDSGNDECLCITMLDKWLDSGLPI